MARAPRYDCYSTCKFLMSTKLGPQPLRPAVSAATPSGMGNAPGTLGVSLDTRQVYAGGVIQGRVFCLVNDTINATSLQVEIYGEEYSHVHWTTTSGSGKNRRTRHHHAYARRRLITVDVALATFPDGQIVPGKYEFPFSALLPHSLPSSMSAYGGGGDCRGETGRLDGRGGGDEGGFCGG